MRLGRIFLILSLCLFFPLVTFAQINFPNYVGYVNDFENILDNDEVLNQKLVNFEKDSTVEIAIVTVADFSGTTLEDYAVKLFENWKIGKADVDNGLLILVSSKERQARIEVGYGLEGTIPDSLAGRIQDQYMIPAFKEGNYSKGVEDSVDALIGIIKEDPTVISNLNQDENDVNVPEIIGIILFFGVYLMAASRSWWLGGVLGFIVGMYFAYTNGIYILPFITTPLGLLIDFILSKTPLGHIVMHSMSHSSSSGSSGGGISFGGGSSGGGGSSRSW